MISIFTLQDLLNWSILAWVGCRMLLWDMLMRRTLPCQLFKRHRLTIIIDFRTQSHQLR